MAVLTASQFASLFDDGTTNNLVLGVAFEGIPYLFLEREFTAGSTISFNSVTYTKLQVLTKVKEGNSKLNWIERREEASTLDLEMLDKDSVLNNLFAINKKPIMFLSANLFDFGSVVAVKTTTPFASSGTIYLGRETITYTAKTGAPAELTGATRGAFGSTAQFHQGGFDSGDPVFDVPQYWLGRRATLIGYYVKATGVYDECVLGTFVVDESPMNTGTGKYSLRCASVIQEFFGAVCGLNVEKDSTVTQWYVADTLIADPEFRVAESDRFVQGTVTDYVMLTYENGNKGIHKLKSITAGLIQIDALCAFGSWGPTKFSATQLGGIGERFNGNNYASSAQKPILARQIAIIAGTSGAIINQLLRSTDGQSGTDNTLPGYTTGAAELDEWRFGAAIPSAKLEPTIIDDFNTAVEFGFVVDKEIKITEIMKEFGMLSNSAFTVTRDGKLKAISLNCPVLTTKTITATDIVAGAEPRVFPDEGSVYPLVTINAGYSPISGDFKTQLNLIDKSLSLRYKNSPAKLELNFRSVGLADGQQATGDLFEHPATTTAQVFAPLISNIVRPDGNVCNRYLSLRLTLNKLDLEIGDFVSLSGSFSQQWSQLPDYAGSYLTTSNKFMLVDKRVDYDQGYIDCKFQVVQPTQAICPSALITATDGTRTILTLGTAAWTNSTPINDFWVNAVVRVYYSASRSYEDKAINSINTGTSQITLASALAATPTANVDYVTIVPSSSGSGTNSAGLGAANMVTLGATDWTLTTSRWG